jgi:SAM-dependent methyltransferase
MPTLDDNLRNWTAAWDWSAGGDDWSRWWGGTPAEWHGVLLPRLHGALPAKTILELAPGYGRWSQYLKSQCEHLVLVDMAPNCIAACRERFGESPSISYHLNDGRSLEMIEDSSIDFVFSFDSLVHAEPAIMDGYLRELARKLTPNGLGFIHHSNAGSLKLLATLTRHLPGRWYRPLVNAGVGLNLTAWRDGQMTARRFRDQCRASGISCIAQELVSWEHGCYLLDCMSMFTLPGSVWDRPLRVLRNPLFVQEARRMRRLYSRASFGSGGAPPHQTRPLTP